VLLVRCVEVSEGESRVPAKFKSVEHRVLDFILHFYGSFAVGLGLGRRFRRRGVQYGAVGLETPFSEERHLEEVHDEEDEGC
jgi:hypothetical protein